MMAILPPLPPDFSALSAFGGGCLGKRFVETGRWKKAWFRKLGSQGRDVWNWLTDNAELCGVWELDLEKFSFEVGFDVTMERIREVFGDRVFDIGDHKIWLPSITKFQNKVLSDACRAHRSIIAELRERDLWDQYLKLFPDSFIPLDNPIDKNNIGLPNPRGLGKGNSQGKGQSNGSGESEGIGSAVAHDAHFDLELVEIFDLYPRFQQKTKSLALMAKVPRDARADLRSAISSYARHCRTENLELKHIKLFINWFDEWRDWLDPKTGISKPTNGYVTPTLDDLPWEKAST